MNSFIDSWAMFASNESFDFPEATSNLLITSFEEVKSEDSLLSKNFDASFVLKELVAPL